MPRKTPSTKETEAAARARFEETRNPEITFERHQELERQEARRQADIAAGTTKTYTPGLPTMTPCGGGDFEDGIDPAEWQGAYGKMPPWNSANKAFFTGLNPFAAFTEGLFPGGLTDADSSNAGTAHQTAVAGPGTDPIVGISLTAPGSKGAVRIGNAVAKYGVELLSKTFIVPASNKSIKFWYAVVMQNPFNHLDFQRGFFWVRVIDTQLGTVIKGAVDLGNGSDRAIADAANPFFQVIPDTVKPNAQDPNPRIVFRDWSCAQINLASHVGKQVTIEFVTADCTASGHYSYAYIDNFCGSCAGSPAGDFNFNAGTSSKCGRGRLCYDYTLPKVTDEHGSVTTGTVDVTLEVLQNGKVVATMASPTLNTGTSYCFDIDPAAIGGLDMGADGFDVVATGNFKIGSASLAPLSVGAAPDGLRDGTNNDYQLTCPAAFSYAVKFVCGTHASCDCACAPVLPGRYATEINIYNHGEEPAEIVKYVIPVVFGGAAAGREPRTVTARAEDRITLPPYSATMDDCCRLSELLLGAETQGPAPLSIGYLEIVSPVELTVTAVYTATGPDGGPVSIEVEQFDAKPRIAPPHAKAGGPHH